MRSGARRRTMPADKPAQGSPLDLLLPLDALLDSFAERVAAELRPFMGAKPARYATSQNNPLGSESGFLEAARRGASPSFKRGRNVVARWEDVEAYIESRRCPARPAAESADVGADREELEKAGVRLRPARGTARQLPGPRPWP